MSSEKLAHTVAQKTGYSVECVIASMSELAKSANYANTAFDEIIKLIGKPKRKPKIRRRNKFINHYNSQ